MTSEVSTHPGRRLRRSLATGALLVPLTASAQFAAVTTEAANMRAGPDRTFPLVSWLPAGVPVNVVGCIDGWRWCDVVSGFNRGWIFARFLSMPFQNQPLMVLNSGAMLGLPLITFSVNGYWGAHYRNRPWWDNRNYWASRPATWHRPPPPPVRPPPPRPPKAQPRPAPGVPGAGRPSSGGRPPEPRPPSTGRPPSGDRPPSSGRPPAGARPPRDTDLRPGQGSG